MLMRFGKEESEGVLVDGWQEEHLEDLYADCLDKDNNRLYSVRNVAGIPLFIVK